MSQHFSPKTVSNGLVLCYDAANIKSFRGIGGTNLATNISYGYNNTNTSTFKYQQGQEKVFIPALGTRTATMCYLYNDYNGGSGQCCPFLFYFGGFNVSPSTTYTYAIIYKNLTGYTNSNYMYRYEYTSNGGSYVTEGGVHSNSNRISLGDGWWYAWGQFTTAATTGYIPTTTMAHYEYATNNAIYVAAVSITAGTYVYPPQHLIQLNTTRGSTVATGGGVLDLVQQQGNAELVNAPSFSNNNLGSFSFNGTNQIIISPESSALNTQTPTVEVWIKTNALNQNGFFFEKGQVNTQYSLFQEGANLVWRQNIGGVISNVYVLSSTYLSTSSWSHIVGTYTSGSRILYVNGKVVASDSQTGTISTNTNGISIGAYGGYNGSRNYYYNGEIGAVRVYNRVLSSAEVLQNYNAQKSRFGV